jgi:hypothetical protein
MGVLPSSRLRYGRPYRYVHPPTVSPQDRPGPGAGAGSPVALQTRVLPRPLRKEAVGWGGLPAILRRRRVQTVLMQLRTVLTLPLVA